MFIAGMLVIIFGIRKRHVQSADFNIIHTRFSIIAGIQSNEA